MFRCFIASTSGNITQFFNFHAHIRTYIRIKTQTKHTMVITAHLKKDFFQKFFLSQNLNICTKHLAFRLGWGWGLLFRALLSVVVCSLVLRCTRLKRVFLYLDILRFLW